MPISLSYGLLVFIRDLLYKFNFLKSVTFNLPVIGIGNLAVGGSGKTPHVEYLIKLLSPYLSLGVMSRGYKRKTKGFRIAQKGDSVLTIGDEPLQYHLKYKDVKVAVSESRSIGIPLLISKHPEIQSILLDDSYQHRSINPGLNILLTDYAQPYYKDFLMPTGRLREWPSGVKRADIIIVTKCPDKISLSDKEQILENIGPLKHQKIYFSKYRYLNPYNLYTGMLKKLDETMEVILVTAIASSDYLVDSLIDKVDSIFPISFEDHHYFNAHEISQLAIQFANIENPNKIILTTEKDATRLSLHSKYIQEKKLPIYVLPISVEFLFEEEARFNHDIQSFLMNFSL